VVWRGQLAALAKATILPGPGATPLATAEREVRRPGRRDEAPAPAVLVLRAVDRSRRSRTLSGLGVLFAGADT
jgi:hypothetical protein